MFGGGEFFGFDGLVVCRYAPCYLRYRFDMLATSHMHWSLKYLFSTPKWNPSRSIFSHEKPNFPSLPLRS